MRWLLVWLVLGCGGPQGSSVVGPSTDLPRRAPNELRAAGCFAGGQPVADVTFTVEPAEQSYRQGKRIVLALSFSSTAADTYQLDAATYDRSGRLHSDTYHVAEEGTADPLADYFGRGGGFAGGGLRSMPMLTAEPVRIERDLNEYVRFDQPGVYVIQVSSARISRDAGPVECVSAPFELAITAADDEADRAAIEEAVRVLRREDAPEEAQVEAARVLRYSLSARAVAPMVELLARRESSVVSFFLEFGLYGTPRRAEAAQALERAFGDRDTPVTPSLFETLVTLRHWLDVPERMPPRPEQEVEAQRWDRTVQEQQERRAEAARDLAARLAALRREKSPAAERTTFATLLEIGLSAGEPPPWFSPLIAELGPRLTDLSVEAQQRLLRDQWRDIASPELLPALIALADRHDPEGPDAEGTVRVLAIRRLAELAPAEGRRRIEAALRREEIDLGYSAGNAIRALPPDAFGSSLDDVLAAGVERADHQLDVRSAALARYASVGAAPRVRAFLEGQHEASDEAEGLLYAFLMRADPRRTSRDIAARVRRARETHERRRAAQMLSALAQHGWDAALEPLAIELLQSDDEMVVEGAAHALERRGGPLGERAIVARLRTLLAPWRDRGSELESDVIRDGSDAQRARTLSYTLLQAFSSADGFVPSTASIDGAAAACVTDECRETVERVRGEVAARPVSLRVILQQSGEVEVWFMTPTFQPSSHVVRIGEDGATRTRAFVIEGQPTRPEGAARYRADAIEWLLARVRSLPRGTEVTLASWPEEGPEVEALLTGLRGWIESHGYRVAR